MILFQIVFSLFNLLLNTILQRILKNHTPYCIVAFCFLFFLNEIHSQELVLKIEASLAKNNPILHQIDYQKRHQDSTTLSLEIHRVEHRLKNRWAIIVYSEFKKHSHQQGHYHCPIILWATRIQTSFH